MAEGEGFEPPVPFQVQRFSRPPVSTTHTSLQPIESTQVDSCPTLSYRLTKSHFGVRGPCLKEVGRYQRGYIYEAFCAFHVGVELKEIVDGKLTGKQRSPSAVHES